MNSILTQKERDLASTAAIRLYGHREGLTETPSYPELIEAIATSNECGKVRAALLEVVYAGRTAEEECRLQKEAIERMTDEELASRHANADEIGQPRRNYRKLLSNLEPNYDRVMLVDGEPVQNAKDTFHTALTLLLGELEDLPKSVEVAQLRGGHIPERTTGYEYELTPGTAWDDEAINAQTLANVFNVPISIRASFAAEDTEDGTQTRIAQFTPQFT